jgi:NAD(P)-dependent dehydrogenase (short-subunit alcohol dehydrogenase family)
LIHPQRKEPVQKSFKTGGRLCSARRWFAKQSRSYDKAIRYFKKILFENKGVRQMATEQKPLQSGFGRKSTAEEVMGSADLHGKTVLITGGYAGIGRETARVLAKAGATVTVGARDLEKARRNLSEIQNVEIMKLDLTDPQSIDDFSVKFFASHPILHFLINNAAVMQTPLMRDSRGNELQFSTNHLGHFQLTARLWGALKNAHGARVVCVSSFGHRYARVDLEDPGFAHHPYDKMKAYGQSKTANALFALELDHRGKAHAIRAFSLHPGAIIETDLARHLTDEELAPWGVFRENGVRKAPEKDFFKNIPQGAATTVWCTVSPQLEGKGGVYCADCDISPLVPDDDVSTHEGVRSWAVDSATAKKLWDLTERLTQVKWPD